MRSKSLVFDMYANEIVRYNKIRNRYQNFEDYIEEECRKQKVENVIHIAPFFVKKRIGDKK